MTVKRSILLIEDEPIIAELYRDILVGRAYHVITAHNKQRAIELMEEHAPKAILLDLMIPIGPGESLVSYDHPVGFDILEWIRHHPEHRQAKVMVLTNLESDEYRRQAESLGVENYFIKANLEPKDIVDHVDNMFA